MLQLRIETPIRHHEKCQQCSGLWWYLGNKNSSSAKKVNIFDDWFLAIVNLQKAMNLCPNSTVQCPRTDLNKRSLPRTKTTIAWKFLPKLSSFAKSNSWMNQNTNFANCFFFCITVNLKFQSLRNYSAFFVWVSLRGKYEGTREKETYIPILSSITLF